MLLCLGWSGGAIVSTVFGTDARLHLFQENKRVPACLLAENPSPLHLERSERAVSTSLLNARFLALSIAHFLFQEHTDSLLSVSQALLFIIVHALRASGSRFIFLSL